MKWFTSKTENDEVSRCWLPARVAEYSDWTITGISTLFSAEVEPAAAVVGGHEDKPEGKIAIESRNPTWNPLITK